MGSTHEVVTTHSSGGMRMHSGRAKKLYKGQKCNVCGYFPHHEGVCMGCLTHTGADVELMASRVNAVLADIAAGKPGARKPHFNGMRAVVAEVVGPNTALQKDVFNKLGDAACYKSSYLDDKYVAHLNNQYKDGTPCP